MYDSDYICTASIGVINVMFESLLHLSQIIYDFQNHQLTLKKDALASFFIQNELTSLIINRLSSG